MSTEAPPRRPVPSGAFYVAARWGELTDEEAPWWARSAGLSIRLRISELLDMAEARQQGALIEESIVRLRKEALSTLVTKSDFLQDRFPAAAGQLRDALADNDKNDQFVPGGRNYSALAAVLEALKPAELVAALIEELARRAENASDWKELAALDEYVELLDSELAFHGHSRTWRHEVAEAAAERLGAGAVLRDALADALAQGAGSWPHDVAILFRAVRVDNRKVEELTGNFLTPKDIEEVLKDWPEVPSADHLDLGGFQYPVNDARDLRAAVERADEWLERQISIWRLQGGDVAIAEEAMYFDRSAGEVGLVDRPSPLRLVPDNIKQFEATMSQEPSQRDFGVPETLPDALVQLSQARTAAPGAALADLWTVAEAVFAGSAAEPRYDAGPVMAELAQFLYPLQLLEWLAGRFEVLGLGPTPSGTLEAVWAIEVVQHRGGELWPKLETDSDPLAYVRAKSFASWGQSQRMSEELEALAERGRRLSNRAYLVRNFSVHRAQPYRARALAVTLPVFAELLRDCLGYVAADTDNVKLPIRAAKVALLQVRACAEHFARERSSDHSANVSTLRTALKI